MYSTGRQPANGMPASTPIGHFNPLTVTDSVTRPPLNILAEKQNPSGQIFLGQPVFSPGGTICDIIDYRLSHCVLDMYVRICSVCSVRICSVVAPFPYVYVRPLPYVYVVAPFRRRAVPSSRASTPLRPCVQSRTYMSSPRSVVVAPFPYVYVRTYMFRMFRADMFRRRAVPVRIVYSCVIPPPFQNV